MRVVSAVGPVGCGAKQRTSVLVVPQASVRVSRHFWRAFSLLVTNFAPSLPRVFGHFWSALSVEGATAP